MQTPTYRQVQYFLKGIAHEDEGGGGPLWTQASAPRAHVAAFLCPLHSCSCTICQVDEHTLDLLMVSPDGTVITRRVHGAVLICVKTAAILGAVLALDNLNEEDYMRLVKQALEPKDRLVALYECQHPWPCFGKPAVIFHDRGKIFTSERATRCW